MFIHHNTLHAFQHLPFHQGVQAGADALGAEPYLTLRAFRGHYRSGRIADGDLRTEIARVLGARGSEPVIWGLTRAELWHHLLVSESDGGDAAGLSFIMRLGVAPQCSDPPRWDACHARVMRGPSRPAAPRTAPRRHRDVLVALGRDDLDPPLHGELIRLGAGFLDQGHAHVHRPNRDLGFTEADRAENIRRVAEVARLMVDAGLIVLVSFISPFRAERRFARGLFDEGEFIEVFVDTPLEECERRDAKGLYAKARAGRLPNFTGISSPYEAPEHPEVHLQGA